MVQIWEHFKIISMSFSQDFVLILCFIISITSAFISFDTYENVYKHLVMI